MKYRTEEALCIRFTRIRVFLFYAIKRYKLKNPRYLGTFCVDGKQTAKKLFVHGFYILVSFLSDIICIMNIGSCYGSDIIP